MAVDEPMSSHIFDRLTSCDPGLAWELCRNYVGYQLLGRDPITVPFLDEAYHYVPFGVVVKKSKRESKHAFDASPDKSSYSIVGSMAHILAPRVDRKPFQQKPEKVFDYNFNDKFVFRISGMKHGVKKAIKVKISGTECYDVSISMELGKLILDKRLPELTDVKKIYVIYEVFYAQSVSVSVTIGEQQPGQKYMDTNNRKFSHDRRMPIGFNAQKFPLMTNGCVGFMEKSALDGLRDGRWKRISRLKSDPLPKTPSYQRSSTNRNWDRNREGTSSRRNPQDLLPNVPTSSKHRETILEVPSSSSS